MEILFQETFGEVEYIWYQTGAESLDELDEQIAEIAEIVNEKKGGVCLYFYTQIVNQDAIGDSVRTAVYVQKLMSERVNMNFNIADSQMAMDMARIVEMKTRLFELIGSK